MDIHTNSIRFKKAKLGTKFNKTGYVLFLAISVVAIIIGLYFIFIQHQYTHFAYLLFAIGIVLFMWSIWWKRDLFTVPVTDNTLDGRLDVAALARLSKQKNITPKTLWSTLRDHWQAQFFAGHLLLSNEAIMELLNDSNIDLANVWKQALTFADENKWQKVEIGFIIASLFLESKEIIQNIGAISLHENDIRSMAQWLVRDLEVINREKQNFGGFARDWAFGFTPILNRFGSNISIAIVNHGAHFGWLTTSQGVKSLEATLTNHAGAVALIGPDGIGKTSHVYALAQKFIEGDTDPSLAYHQIIELNASQIISTAQNPGDLEHIVNSIANEALHAGHIILFFDDAYLFFGTGTGSFDATNILLPIIQSKSIPIVFAMSPQEYQNLRSSHTNFANLITPIVLQEMPENNIFAILEDTTTNLEGKHKILISYDAIHEAYRLSGRYSQDEAYPGKAIKLLEQSIPYATHKIVTAKAVQQAIEKTHGVKVSSANPVEAETLLHLEDKIHERMINQTHAVNVIASALRRARAGVTNPGRPIGSFLFLGPTGVGKTELAKAIASVYFGTESSLLRMDMSEYQQPDDVQRLLSTGENETSSLIMSIRQQPFAVVLLDEIEKAHPNILNLLLQLLDEGQLTDSSGRKASFKDCIVIVTSNAGADEIRNHIEAGEDIEKLQKPFTDQLISSGQFKPELLNRFDEIVLFRPLTNDELGQVVQLMLKEVNATLSSQNISVELTKAGIQKIVTEGNDPRLGARPMRRMLQRTVENLVAKKILSGEAHPGDHLVIDVQDFELNN